MASIYDKASLVMIPSGTKASKIFSQKPVNGDGDFTFSRSTAATRVNADGNIEKETQNLLIRSNTFNTGWSPVSGTFSQGVTDPFGGNTAWSFTAVNTDPYFYQPVSVTGVLCASLWVKGVGSSIGKNGQIRIGSDIKTFTITDEWVRYEHFANMTATFSLGFEIPNPAVAGDVVHIYGAQLEQGLVARDYIETTTAAVEGGITDNVPRLDYTDSSCPALLLEPQRTNLLPHSEFTDGYFKNNVTWTYNDAESPEGVDNALKSTFSGAGYFGDNLSVTAGTTYTFSLYLKGDANKSCRIYIDGNGSGGYFFTQNQILLDGTWTRYELTYTIPAGAGSTNFVIQNSSWGGNTSVTELYSYGLQIEAGSYATSYIPTYGSAVTRNKDSISLYNQDDLFGDGQGTWAIDINVDSRLYYNYSIIGSYPNYIGINVSTTYMDMEIVDNTVLTGQIRYNNSSTGRFKMAVAYDGNSALFYVNGTKVGEDTSVSIPSVNDIFLRNNEANANTFKYNQALLFTTKLTEEELEDLTTL